MNDPEKIGLVVEGGGMKCAYNAGILDAFIDHGVTFDYCIGVSGGAGNAASFVAGQRGRNIRFYTEHTHSPRFFGLRSLLRSGDLFGLKYIYGDLTNSSGKDPLDFKALMNSPTRYELVVTNAATGKPEYYGKEDMKQDDYRLVMASCAIPVACRPVEIDGNLYFDGGLTDAIPADHALQEGCDRLVLLLSRPRGYIKTPQNMRWLYSRLGRRYPNIVSVIDQRHVAYNENLKKVYELEQEGKAFIFAPSRAVKAGTYSMKEDTERELYALGFHDFEEQYEKLKKFMKI